MLLEYIMPLRMAEKLGTRVMASSLPDMRLVGGEHLGCRLNREVPGGYSDRAVRTTMGDFSGTTLRLKGKAVPAPATVDGPGEGRSRVATDRRESINGGHCGTLFREVAP